MTYRYPVTKEYITLPITNQETLEIAVWLGHQETAWSYISVQIVENPSLHFFSGLFLSNLMYDYQNAECSIWRQIFLRQA